MRESTDYRALFLSDAPLLDTRSPAEFARGSFPTAVNLPLLTDEERAQVGLCYKRQGQAAAIALGHRLVCGAVKEARVARWVAFARAHPDGFLYCWRGGLRSQICQEWLREAGVDYPRVAGGYKAMRRFLLGVLEESATRPLILIGGCTGAGKTALLARLANAVDLEALAHHRGSAFGARPGGQPSQIDFENALAIALLKAGAHWPDRPVLLEDEGKLVGRCALPLPLRAAMAEAPLVVVERPLAERVEHTFRAYILDALAEWQAACGEEAGFAAFADHLRTALGRIRRRLGGERHARAAHLLEEALAAHRRGDPALHRRWIELLLAEYYDPMYDYQLANKRERVIFAGRPEAVAEFLSAGGKT